MKIKNRKQPALNMAVSAVYNCLSLSVCDRRPTKPVNDFILNLLWTRVRLPPPPLFKLGYGVMVALRVLVPLVKVRVLVSQ